MTIARLIDANSILDDFLKRYTEMEKDGKLVFAACEIKQDFADMISNFQYTSGFDEAVTKVENFPSADVAPVRHGQWETNSDRPDTLICSVCKCGFDMWKHDPHNFCPNCGARMDEVNE